MEKLYRLTPFSKDAQPGIRGKCPLELAGYDLCGHQSDFFENTIREIKAMSRKKKVRLGDSDTPEHVIVFYKGEMKVSHWLTDGGWPNKSLHLTPNLGLLSTLVGQRSCL